MKSNNNKTNGFSTVLILIVVILFMVLGYIYVINGKNSYVKVPNIPVSLNTNSDPNIIKTKEGTERVTFPYTVKSISKSLIVLTGKNGDMTLPNDTSKVQLFNGSTKDSPMLELSSLKVGNTVSLEFKLEGPISLFLSTN